MLYCSVPVSWMVWVWARLEYTHLILAVLHLPRGGINVGQYAMPAYEEDPCGRCRSTDPSPEEGKETKTDQSTH